ncbi:MAG: thiamine biosynthesis protein ApbE [Armatimonadetes bacterium CP1_7O]|jgi:thiamine biosynthesis lipoprotein|nr:MAG: thiamine biosynthesis protein ApbE [Armatimonadetes bacterium CP1_7O]
MFVFRWRAMGTEFAVHLPEGDARTAESIAGMLREETQRLEHQLSLYLPDSDLCFLNAHAHQHPVRVEPELFQLLQTCKSLYALTEGVFDPTVTPLLRLWGFVDKQFRVPTHEAVEETLPRVGMELVLLEPEGRWVYYALPGVELSFGAIGKGWAIAQCVRLLRSLGVGSALIDSGGSTLYALGAPPDAEGWQFRMPDGSEALLRDAAVGVSGDAEQYFEVEGVRYGHIIDPRTGYPAPSRPPVAVIGDDPVLCDALSTAIYIEPPLAKIARTRCKSVSVSTAIDGCSK